MEAHVDREVSMDRIAELERAFASFSLASRELESSYAALEARVATLTDALGSARQERRCQRRDNARLARRLELLMQALPALAESDCAGLRPGRQGAEGKVPGAS